MCPICCESAEGCAPLVCGHTLHPKCLSGLLKRATFVEPAKCPLCRACIEPSSEADDLCLEGYNTNNEGLLLAALQLDPMHVFAMYCLGLYYKMMNVNPHCAVKYFTKGMLTHPMVTGTRFYQHRLASVSCRTELAVMCHEEDMEKEALQHLRIAMRELTDLDMKNSCRGLTILSGFATVYHDMENWPKAIYFYQKLLNMELQPDFHVDILTAFIETLSLAKYTDAATESARLLVRLFPAPEHYFILGQCLHVSGEAREAVGAFEIVRYNTPVNTQIHISSVYFSGVLHESLNEDLVAVVKYNFVIQFHSHRYAIDAHTRLAAIYDAYGMPQQAASMRAEVARLSL
jgi:tetratricopeptide (TPR) repeat protein